MRIVGVLVLASVLCATAPAETIRSLPNRSIGMYDVGPVWSPDGTQLLFSRIWSAPKAGEAYWLGTVRNDGSGFRIFPRPRAEQWDLGASYSPDGTRLLMTRSEDYEVGSAVYVKDLASGAEQRLTPADATEFGAGWSPDGSRVLVLRDRDDDRVAYIERPDGTDVRELPIPHGRIFVRYLTDGALLVSRYGRDTTTFERLEHSGTLRPLPIPAARWSLSSIARAAKVMALVRDAGYEQPTLWIAHVDGTGLRKVANGEGGALSPDGTRVATAWSPWGRNGIRIVDVATGAARTLVAHGSSPSWSPDGRTIAYAAAGPCLNLGVYVVAAAGGSPRRITNDCRIVGTPKNDVLLGTSERDVMRGLGGNDVIRANPGDRPPDHYGNWDFDFVDGGPGDDTITGARGIDVLLGGPGNDHIFGGAGPDTLYGGPGRDVLDGGRYHDRIFAADDERDVVRCGTGEDHVVADRIDVLSKCNHVTFR